jgi:hypothetical protein
MKFNIKIEKKRPSFITTSFPFGTSCGSVTQYPTISPFVKQFINSDWIRWCERYLNTGARTQSQEGGQPILSGPV